MSREESSAKERTNIRRVAVVGGGVMGSGIAQLAALSGYEVVLKELTPELARVGMKRIEELTVDAVKKGIVSRGEAEARLRTVTQTSEWGPLQNADLVIEAVVERDDVKRAVFSELSRQLPPEAILTTNTSSLTVGRVCEPASNQTRTAGLHFFNPVHRMQLVEVVRGPETDSRTVGALVEFVRKLGKVPVVVADGPGFLVNRVLFPYLDEAVRMLEAGFLTTTIDRAAVSFGMPMGPLELLDQVGLDVAAEVARSLQVASNDPSPTPVRLSEMVKSGFLGRKSGSGFYHWKNGRRRQPTHRGESSITYEDRSMKSGAGGPGALSFLQQRLLYPMVNEAAHCLELGTADAPWVVDLAMVLGIGFAPYLGGPLRAADHWGIKQVVADMDRLHRACGDRFEPCASLREMSRNGRSFYPMTEHASAVSASMGRVILPPHENDAMSSQTLRDPPRPQAPTPTFAEAALRLGGKGAEEVRRTGAVDAADDQVESLYAERYQTTGSPIHRAIWDRAISPEQWTAEPPTTSSQVQGVMQASLDVVRQRAQGVLLDADGKVSEETLHDLADAGYWGLLIERSQGGVRCDLLAICRILDANGDARADHRGTGLRPRLHRRGRSGANLRRAGSESPLAARAGAGQAPFRLRLD